MRCPANRHWIGSLTVALAVACGPGSAQAPAPVPVPSKTPAQVSGAVVDATGAAITGAQVTVTDVATGQKYTTKSDDRGFFQFSNLTPGDLRLTAELSGFSVLSKYDRSPGPWRFTCRVPEPQSGGRHVGVYAQPLVLPQFTHL